MHLTIRVEISKRDFVNEMNEYRGIIDSHI